MMIGSAVLRAANVVHDNEGREKEDYIESKKIKINATLPLLSPILRLSFTYRFLCHYCTGKASNLQRNLFYFITGV